MHCRASLKREIPSTLGPAGDTARQRWSQSWGHMVPKGHGDGSQWQRPSGRGQVGSEMCLGCGEVEEEGLSSLGAPQNQILGADGWRGRQRSGRRKAGPYGLLCGAGMPLDSTSVGHPGPAHHRVPGDPCVTHILSPALPPSQRQHLLWPQTGLDLRLGLPSGQTWVLWLCNPLKHEQGLLWGLTLLPWLWVPLWEPVHMGTQASWASGSTWVPSWPVSCGESLVRQV